MDLPQPSMNWEIPRSNESCAVANSPRHPVLRSILAPPLGIVFGVYIWMACAAGVEYNHGTEPAANSWGFLFWGDHYFIRLLWSLVATAVAGSLSGLIARTRGPLVGAISAIPTAALWAAGVTAWTLRPSWAASLDTDLLSWQNKALSVLLVAISVPVGAWGGALGQSLAEQWGPIFNRRRYSFLGIRWYHCFWVPFVLYLVVMQAAWAIDYGLGWYRIAASEDEALGVAGLIATIFLTGVASTLYLTGYGLSKAYDYLTDLKAEYSWAQTVKGVLAYGLGFPFLAAVAQSLIMLAHYGLSKLLS